MLTSLCSLVFVDHLPFVYIVVYNFHIFMIFRVWVTVVRCLLISWTLEFVQVWLLQNRRKKEL